MSKYKVGDRFIVEVEELVNEGKLNSLYRIKGLNAFVFDDNWLNKLEQLPDAKPDGMTAEEVWEVARMIVLPGEYGGMSTRDFHGVFGEGVGFREVLRDITPQEAKAKIDAWQAAKEQIQVGDVVSWANHFGVVARIGKEGVSVLESDGIAYNIEDGVKLRKTGRHIDIQSILGHIGGDGDA